MKIGFWSPVPGIAGVSSSVIAVSLIASSQLGLSSCIMQSSYNPLNGLQRPLLGKQNEEQSYFYDDVGIDAIMRHVAAGDRSQATIKDCCVKIGAKLRIIPATTRTKEVYESDFIRYEDAIATIIGSLKKVAFFDIEAGTSAVSMKMIHSMDFLVVCIPQNLAAIEHVLSLDLPDKDIFYLFSNHDNDSYYNKKNLFRLFAPLTKTKSAVIPYCTQFKDALNQSNVIHFFDKHVELDDKNNELYRFFNECKNATNEIVKAAGLIKNGDDEGGN